MQWYNTNKTNSIFPDLTIGINLREELHTILHGSSYYTPLGHWVVLRHFDNTKKSSYYNVYTKEGVGGPANIYNDILIKTRKIPSPRTIEEDSIKAGDIFLDKFVYYFEYDTKILMGDQIYELDIADHTFKPASYNFIEKYDIKRIHPYRLENGNIQYFAVLCVQSDLTY